MELVHSRPVWAPLEKVVERALLGEFMFMGTKHGIHQYKHRNNRQYLNIDENSGDFYKFNADGSYRRIPKEDALATVGIGRVRCIICDGTKVLSEMRPMAIYQGLPTRVVVGRCNRCDANGFMLPAPTATDAKKEACHD